MALYGNSSAGSRHADLLPVLSLIVGAMLWGVIWYPMRLLEHDGLEGLWLTLLLYGSALVVSLPFIVRGLRVARVGAPLLLLALLAGWTNVAFVLAVLAGNIVRVMLLFYLSPAWTVLLARLFLGERVSQRAVWTVLASFVGAVALLWRPGGVVSLRMGGADWLALSAGVAFAASNVTTKRLSGVSLTAKSASVWVGVVAVAGLLTVLLHLPVPKIAETTLFGAIALGVGGILTMTWLVQFGVTHLPAQRSSVIMLTELISGAASQRLLTSERMAAGAWAGGLLIAIAAYVASRPSS
ncbi:MAG: DMT family transporter [Acidiferrobacteraceae bacterium]